MFYIVDIKRCKKKKNQIVKENEREKHNEWMKETNVKNKSLKWLHCVGLFVCHTKMVKHWMTENIIANKGQMLQR